jgi:hypothetical protein
MELDRAAPLHRRVRLAFGAAGQFRRSMGMEAMTAPPEQKLRSTSVALVRSSAGSDRLRECALRLGAKIVVPASMEQACRRRSQVRGWSQQSRV